MSKTGRRARVGTSLHALAVGFLLALAASGTVRAADVDQDGLVDADEVSVYLTNPGLLDSDGDGHSDGLEVASGSNPQSASSIPFVIDLGISTAAGLPSVEKPSSFLTVESVSTSCSGASPGCTPSLNRGGYDPARAALARDVDADGLRALFEVNDDDAQQMTMRPPTMIYSPDSDGDLIGNLQDFDDDQDGLSDVTEQILGTSTLVADNDGDGVLDPVDEDTYRNLPLVGATAGEATVTDSGSASYSVPIVVAPGTGGVQPVLTLSYDSEQGRGMLGIGWALAGLPSIARCPASFEPDGILDPVDFDASDRFCLNGTRLVSISGSYGADGTEYRSEVESFQRIVSYGQAGTGPARFTVWARDGRILTFGATADSRIEAPGRAEAVKWLANRIEDRFGNYMTVTYSESSGVGYPARIDYTGNATQGVSPYNSVQFAYEVRPDPVQTYMFGSEYRADLRMSAVRTYAGQTLIREYRLTYQGDATGASRLTQLQECAGDGRCLQPTTFTWQPYTTGYTSTTTWASVPFDIPNTTADASGYVESAEFPDINGDGKADLVLSRGYLQGSTSLEVALSDGSQFVGLQRWDNPNQAPFDPTYGSARVKHAFGDFNGDGKMDLSLLASEGAFYIALSNGTTFSAPVFQFYSYNACLVCVAVDHPDLNGDGRDDIVLRDASNSFYAALSLGTSFTTPALWITHPDGVSGLFGEAISGEASYPDVDGDGRSDMIFRRSNNQFLVSLSTGSGLTPSQLWLQMSGTPADDAVYTDVTGDGLTDLIYRKATDGSQTSFSYSVLRGTGTGFTAPELWLTRSGRPLYMDANRDGRTDLVIDDQNNLIVHLSTGFTFQTPTVWGTHPSLDPNVGSTLSFGDVDGNGIADPVVIQFMGGATSAQSSYAIAPYLNAAPPTNLIVAIDNGLGYRGEWTYRPLTDSAIYDPDAGALYPIMEARTGRWVLSEMRTSDAMGGFHTRTMRYGGLRVSAVRGPLGFRWRQQTDLLRGIVETIQYNQQFPLEETVHTVESRLVGSGLLLSRQTDDWRVRDESSGTKFIYVERHVEESFELNGTFVGSKTKTNTYDAFGNLATSLEQTDDGWSTSTTLAYTNDPTRWLIGLETARTTISSGPGVPNLTRTWSFQNDAQTGRRTLEVSQPQTAFELRSEYQYDGFGNRVTETISGADIVPRTSLRVYDARGQFVISEVNPLGHLGQATYDGRFGVRASETDVNGNLTTTTYDALGRPLQQIRPDGTHTLQIWGYCTPSLCPTYAQMVKRTIADGQPETAVYIDALAQEWRKETMGFDGRRIYQDVQYDALGRITRQSRPYYANDPAHWTLTSYDELDRVQTETAPDGGISSNAYAGRTVTSTNALGQQHVRRVDGGGRTAEVIDDYGSHQTYRYDAHGNLISVTDPQGSVVTLAYDIYGRRIMLDDPDLGAWQYGYNVLGELVSQTDAKGAVSLQLYDVLGRPLMRTESDGVTEWTYDTAPHGIGLLAEEEGPDTGFSRSFEYDALSRPLQSTTRIDGQSYVQSTTYDLRGRTETLTYPGGLRVRHLYSSAGYLSEVRNDQTSMPYWRLLARDADGEITRQSSGNGLVTERFFDPETGRVEAISTGTMSASGVQDLSYEWDLLGNLTRREDLNQSLTETFGYDDLNRLTAATVAGRTPVTYAYDAVGNVTFKSDVGTYTYGQNGAGPHAVTTTSDGRTYQYDLNGNLVQRSGDPGATTYTVFNKPRQIFRQTSTGAQNTTLRYGAGRELIHQRAVWSSGKTVDTTYVGGGLYEKVATTQGGSTSVEERHYIKAGDESVAVVTKRPGVSNETRYLHYDHIGSLDAITDALGAVVERLSFDPHGQRRQANWMPAAVGAIQSSLARGFTGHEQLDNVGLIYMNARVYDPHLGRFMTPDPTVQFPESTQGMNRYTYANNNPLSYVDPTGYGFRRFIKKLGRTIFKATPFYIAYQVGRGIAAAIKSGNVGQIVLSIVSAVVSFINPGIGLAVNLAISAATADSLKSFLIGFAVSFVVGRLLPIPAGPGFWSQVAASSAQGALSGAASAAIQGKDPYQGAGAGFVGGAVSGIANQGVSRLGGAVTRGLARDSKDVPLGDRLEVTPDLIDKGLALLNSRAKQFGFEGLDAADVEIGGVPEGTRGATRLGTGRVYIRARLQDFAELTATLWHEAYHHNSGVLGRVRQLFFWETEHLRLNNHTIDLEYAIRSNKLDDFKPPIKDGRVDLEKPTNLVP